MTIDQLQFFHRLLIVKGVVFEDGLLTEEIVAVESKYSIKFPPDLEAFLMHALPVSSSFVNWRGGVESGLIEESIFARLQLPLSGILFDVQENNLWMEEWGPKPLTVESQMELVAGRYHNYPKLIPVFSHRYISGDPSIPGNPIFSVHQSDIIVYGNDLSDYLQNEFSLKVEGPIEGTGLPVREISFWSNLIG